MKILPCGISLIIEAEVLNGPDRLDTAPLDLLLVVIVQKVFGIIFARMLC